MIRLTKQLCQRWLEKLLHVHDTPQRTAAAFALGVFCGFSPFMGLHTAMGLGLAFLFNLNRIAALLGVYSNLPWILPAYYTLATVAGAGLLRADVPPGLLEQLTAAATEGSWSDLRHIAGSLKPLLWSYTVGSTLGAALLAAVAYRISLTMILAHRHALERTRTHSPDSK